MNNPPAFPCGYHPEGNSADQPGMRLGDWFAGMALSRTIERCAAAGNVNENYVAAKAYAYSDAMLAERERRTKAAYAAADAAAERQWQADEIRKIVKNPFE